MIEKKKEYRRQQPRNAAVIGHYYPVLNEGGEKDYGIVRSQIEKRTKPVIDKLEVGSVITPEVRFDISFFMASLLSRTPKFEREIEQLADAVHKIIAKQMIPTVEAAAELLRMRRA